MSLLLRKIDIGKWRQREFIDNDEISADAITLCLKTSGNTISVWKIESEDYIDEAVLAFISRADHLEAAFFVLLSEEHLNNNKISIEQRDDETPYKAQIKNHMVLTQLSYKTLGVIAHYILNEVKNDKIKSYAEGRLKRMFAKAISSGKIDMADLKDDIKKKILRFNENQRQT
ncbi:MAG: hypothetical protein ABSG73_08945 [Candidatus Aminicenantales bacterium]|jgi:hypothetical protein